MIDAMRFSLLLHNFFQVKISLLKPIESVTASDSALVFIFTFVISQKSN